MKATGRMINYIRRDELTHVTLFAHIIREIKNEFPGTRDENLVYEMFKTAVDQEIKRSQFILGNKIIGTNDHTTEVYTKWIANNRLGLLGLLPLYPEIKENPYKHLDRLQESNLEK